jgi:DNA-binding transcriptional regulator YdaS (Cro superfamily)
MHTPESTRKLLEIAVTRAGGAEQLAATLGISPRMLRLYESGSRPLPDTLFLRIVDMLSKEPPEER